MWASHSSSKLGRRAQYKATPTPGNRRVHNAINSGAKPPLYPRRDKSSGMNDAADNVNITKSNDEAETSAEPC